MFITILGSCANQISNREGVALLLESEKNNLLIDCGPGIVASFGRANRKTSEITNLLLTHVHGDHTAGFPYFVWNRNFERIGKTPASDLHVYGTKETIELASFSLEHSYPELKFPFSIFYHTIELCDNIVIGDMSVKTISAIHTVPCLACIIESKKKKIVYSCDTLPNAELLKYAKGADFLVHEGMLMKDAEPLAKIVRHSLAKDAGQFAKKANVKHLALVHIAPMIIGRETALIAEAQEEFDGIITIPFDGTVYGI